MIVNKKAHIRPGDIMWNVMNPDNTYKVNHICTRDWHSHPCYVVSGKGIKKAHIGPTYYVGVTWKYKNPCMFTKEAKDNAK